MRPLATLMLLSTVAYAGSPEKDLRKVAARKIFFGHQSVGGNLLDGIATLATQAGVPVRIAQGKDAKALEAPGIVHLAIGANEDPSRKLAHFRELIDGGLGDRAELAFFKFCYVDFNAGSNVSTLFAEYQRTLAGLKAKYPKTAFVHFTVPLTTTQGGPRGFLKNLTGAGAWGERENIKRHELNELLRTAYAGKEPLFDLARAEATAADGTLSTFSRDGRSFPRLQQSYSDDGQHLNASGRLWVARQLVSYLAGLPLRS
ncbi:MAG: hypothetical protein ACYC8T_31755 [Myxococcaceae bacterium]